jgi:hypothetical protein
MIRYVIGACAAILVVVSVVYLARQPQRTEVETECLKEHSAEVCDCMSMLIGNRPEPVGARTVMGPKGETRRGVQEEEWIDAFTACVAALP